MMIAPQGAIGQQATAVPDLVVCDVCAPLKVLKCKGIEQLL